MSPLIDVQTLHDTADTAGLDGYIDPNTGLFALTAGRLRRAGSCCGSGCRHCPWPPDEQARAGRPGSRATR